MALIRTLVFTVSAVLFVSSPISAQNTDDGPSRPSFLQAMGLLQQRDVGIRRDGAPFASLALPEGGGVRAVQRDLGERAGEVIGAWDFVTEDGAFIESLTLTLAKMDLAESETRRFALANLLVLRSFPQLVEQFPDARLLTFGPVRQTQGLDMVQMVGTFSSPGDERPLVFRHIGVLQPDSTDVLIAIVNIDTSVLPIRGNEALLDTYAGRALDTLVLGPFAEE